MTAATRLGRYRVGERIGTGGVADVFVATAEGGQGWGKKVVVKCLRPHVADIAEVVEGLIGEATLAQRLQHGNIVQVFDFAVQDGLPYVVMEHVDGCTLADLNRDLARRGERLPLEAALHVVECLAAALAYAHRLVDDEGMPLSIVHRDVKPSNILLSSDGLVKLADFGIAKVAHRSRETLPGQLKGTPAYWAPEQAAGDPVDGRTDVYGLGAVLVELVGEADDNVLPPDARVDPTLRAVMAEATAPRASERLPSMRAMIDRLRDWAADNRVRPSGEPVSELVRRAKRGKPVALRVALDSALLSAGRDGVTQQRAPTSATSSTRRGWKRPAVAGLLAAAVVLAIVAGFGGGGATARDVTPPVTKSTPPENALRAATPAAKEAVRPSVQPSPEPSAVPPTDAIEPAAPAPDLAPPATVKPHKARKGLLKVNTLPWATVSIDGKPYGRVPVEVRLSAGRHRVVLTNPTVGTKVRNVTIKSGGELRLTRWPN